MLTEREEKYCATIAERIERMRVLANERTLGNPESPSTWYEFLSALRQIQGNSSNALSFVATLLAKRYLEERFPCSFDAAKKPQGAPGIDIDLRTLEGDRVIGEIKTTVPYLAADFGAQQAASFKKDFDKLRLTIAEHKFLFVTEQSAFSVLKKPNYTKHIPGIRIVLLTTGEDHIA